MLSSTSDYALRAILALAQADTGRPMRADEIARVTGAPANYLA
jgi:DNA-binding IscR family transcriptional regulator